MMNIFILSMSSAFETAITVEQKRFLSYLIDYEDVCEKKCLSNGLIF